MPVRPHEHKLSFVSVSDRMFAYVDDVEWHAAMRRRALETFDLAWICKAQQGEAAAEKIERRSIFAQPRVRRSPAGPRRGMIGLRIVGLRRRAVGNADRRILVAIAELQSHGSELAADLIDEDVADASAQRCAGRACLLERIEPFAPARL